ncbi:hypothetical protein ACHAWF_003814 [Thalassiosira exigua]
MIYIIGRLEGLSIFKEDLAYTKRSLAHTNAACGCERAIIKFFHKRCPCSCLVESYAAAKRDLPRIGVCNNCSQKKNAAS